MIKEEVLDPGERGLSPQQKTFPGPKPNEIL
jgi:hypothetical protein